MAEPSPPSPSPSHWEKIGARTEALLNVRSEIEKQRSRMSALTDRIGRVLAHPLFFILLLAAHLLWILFNLPIFPWAPWDPYPFTFLATVASAEAPFIALLILMYQKRDRRIDELREETSLQVLLHVEHQLSLALRLLDELQEKMGVETQQDPAFLKHMQEDLDPRRVMENIREDLEDAEGNEASTSP